MQLGLFVIAFGASLLASGAPAGEHRGHMQYHNVRRDTANIVEGFVITETATVTVIMDGVSFYTLVPTAKKGPSQVEARTSTISTQPLATATSRTAKRGLAYNNAMLASLFTDKSQVSWAYNWDSTSSLLPIAFEYVPMLWGIGVDHTERWDSAVSSAVASGSTHLLSFNEPDHPDQANISPGIAAAGYMRFIQPYANKAKVGAPAVTNGGAPMGLAFLKSFLIACLDCTIDFVPIHWYGLASNVDNFKSHIKSARDAAGGRPIWITEFGAAGSIEEQTTFLQEVIPWLDGTDYVERYAYFDVDTVLTQDYKISALGKTFVSYAA
ncbi:hypothetical protein ACLOAV_008384 [Pseudogymnoascus australis]